LRLIGVDVVPSRLLLAPNCAAHDQRARAGCPEVDAEITGVGVDYTVDTTARPEPRGRRPMPLSFTQSSPIASSTCPAQSGQYLLSQLESSAEAIESTHPRWLWKRATSVLNRRAQFAAKGADEVVADALDAGSVLEAAVRHIKPDVIINKLTALPKHYTPEEMKAAAARDKEVRVKGNANLLASACAANCGRYVLQSSAFWYAPGPGLADETVSFAFDASPRIAAGCRTYADLKAAAQESGLKAVLLRYGFFYGPGTWFTRDGDVGEQVRRREMPVSFEPESKGATGIPSEAAWVAQHRRWVQPCKQHERLFLTVRRIRRMSVMVVRAMGESLLDHFSAGGTFIGSTIPFSKMPKTNRDRCETKGIHLLVAQLKGSGLL
jgi:NAD-dependent epimerase/dehydratase family protein